MATLYPATNDGYIQSEAADWATARQAATGNSANSTITRYHYAIQGRLNSGTFYVTRTFIAFDTSAISAAPTEATLSIRGYSTNYSNVIAVKADAPANLSDALTTAEFDSITDYSSSSSMAGVVTDYSSAISWSKSSTRNEIVLNAAALADMASEDIFRICLVDYTHDYLNSAPSSSNGSSGMYYIDYTGTFYDPFIEYPAVFGVKQDGSADYTTIGNAINAASSGDVVEIQDSSTYNEGNLIHSTATTSNLTVRAAAGMTPVMDGQNNYACAIQFYTGWVIKGLTITNYDGSTGLSASGAGLIGVGGARKATIIDCTIHNVSDHALTDLADDSIIENCKIYNITGGASGIQIGTSYNVFINQCLIYDTSGYGINSTNSGTVIKQCTLYNVNYSTPKNYGVLATLGTVQHCIILDPLHNCGEAGLRAATHSYNCVSGSEGATSGNFYGGAGTGDIVSNPLISSGTFRLQDGSPCIGAAVGSTRSKDFVSGSRDWNYNTSNKVMGVNSGATPHDMGAIEFNYTTVSGVDTQNISKILGVS